MAKICKRSLNIYINFKRSEKCNIFAPEKKVNDFEHQELMD